MKVCSDDRSHVCGWTVGYHVLMTPHQSTFPVCVVSLRTSRRISLRLRISVTLPFNTVASVPVYCTSPARFSIASSVEGWSSPYRAALTSKTSQCSAAISYSSLLLSVSISNSLASRVDVSCPASGTFLWRQSIMAELIGVETPHRRSP